MASEGGRTGTHAISDSDMLEAVSSEGDEFLSVQTLALTTQNSGPNGL
jgi:hypothetical protein